MNANNYTNSSNAYTSYADLFVAQKDTINKIAYYKKALTIQDNADTKSKLSALEGKPAFDLTVQELQKYTGLFTIEGFSVTVLLYIKDGALWSSVSGQNESQFIPLSPDTFTVKNTSGFTITFHMEAGKASGFTSVQPNGTFVAHLKI